MPVLPPVISAILPSSFLDIVFSVTRFSNHPALMSRPLIDRGFTLRGHNYAQFREADCPHSFHWVCLLRYSRTVASECLDVPGRATDTISFRSRQAPITSCSGRRTHS